ncbi:MAG TPA: TetR family transcriptional regulator [Ruania sp.]|nr:TetR family transcriptional regulator [Ruania sp.]
MARGLGTAHEDQVATLTAAAVRVLDRDGLPALTFRRVAAEAGVSPGRVQHYFRTSQGLAAATFRRVRQRVQERVQDQLTTTGATPSPGAVVAGTLRALIPQARTEVAELRVAQLVELHASTDPALGAELRAGRTSLVDFLASQVAAQRGDDPGGDDARRTATLLLATAEGLAGMTIAGVLTHEEANDLLGETLRRVLGPSAQRDRRDQSDSERAEP